MTIELKNFYQNIRGVKIQPGVYADDDPDLKGLGEYLLKNGQAVRTEVAPSSGEVALDDPVDTEEDDEAGVYWDQEALEAHTKPELIAQAGMHGLDLDMSMSKADMIDAMMDMDVD